jgi:C_GCAxxG_C_C family probable redox protein
LQEKIGIINQDVFKAASALGEGVAGHGETCGALTGAIIVIGSLRGNEWLEDVEQNQKAMESAIRIYNRFKEKVGHTLCGEIQKIRYGKTYRLFIPEERQAFHDMGGHSRNGCPEVCGIAAQIAAEVILDIKGNS